MVAGSTRPSPAQRSSVAWKGDLPSRSGRNCFGYDSRDIGQSRVPQPPARMTGWSFMRGGPASLVGILLLEDDEDRPPDDLQVELERPVAQVFEVVRDAHHHLVDRLGLAAHSVHLRPAGDAGAHLVPDHVAL